jgi:hypothetical protein
VAQLREEGNDPGWSGLGRKAAGPVAGGNKGKIIGPLKEFWTELQDGLQKCFPHL